MCVFMGENDKLHFVCGLRDFFISTFDRSGGL